VIDIDTTSPPTSPTQPRERARCSVSECAKPGSTRSMCSMHAMRVRDHGTTDPQPKPTQEERFWTKVNMDGEIPSYRPDLGPCWVWKAFLSHGYGQFGRNIAAHRFAYETLVGPIPEGLHLDHLCRVTSCVNPKHLEPVTRAVNLQRGAWGWHIQEQREITHCPFGHEYAGHNLKLNKDGQRRCRICANEHQGRYRAGKFGPNFPDTSWKTTIKLCLYGHPYSGDNLVMGTSRRYCRACQNPANRTGRRLTAPERMVTS
jgi:HNH endonuclease